MKTRRLDKYGKAYVFDSADSAGAKSFPESVSEKVPSIPETGYAGFGSREGLKSHLEWAMAGGKEVFLDHEKIFKITESALEKCAELADSDFMHVFAFPTFDDFVKEKMGGVSGYSFWKNTMLVYISTASEWEPALFSTVCHEFSHAVALNFFGRKTLLDDIVFEGIAEHFREAAAGGKTPWASALTRKEAEEIFADVRDKLDTEDPNVSKEAFYGTGSYPLWAGYSVGYHMVADYLNRAKRKGKIDWNAILRKPPAEIYEKSGWGAFGADKMAKKSEKERAGFRTD